MKVKEIVEVEFKEAEYLCKCGTVNKVISLVINGYGFNDSYCKNCGKRYKIEIDENFVYIKSI
ncbi:MAG: hypothetical protein N2Z81_00825 [Hydrogenothermaceae bacterium]|nr:hypothetical protein [Hydrogenothermaceae bacterium]